ncbi:PAS domain S-box-containing protein [Methylorubrum extorquens]
MFGARTGVRSDAEATLAAVSRKLGIIEFSPDGTVLTANENFLAVIGYSLPEIQGQQHSLFVAPAYKVSAAYQAFWEILRAGKSQTGRYKRLAKGGREVWIEATYNSVFDRSGKPYKVVKIATDVTRQVAEEADLRGQIEAINTAQAVISFSLDGVVQDANPNFLTTLGYSLPEIQGQHHSFFVEPAYKTSTEYRAFWDKLRAGEYVAGQFKRIGKGGREIWIEAS